MFSLQNLKVLDDVGSQCTMSSVTINTNVSVGSVRKCGVCSKEGHDKRNCPSGITATVAKIKEPSAIHLQYMSRAESGIARLTDPTSYWAALGADSGTYPLLRDPKGALHYPAILKGSASAADRAEIDKLAVYVWNSEKKVYERRGPCPGC